MIIRKHYKKHYTNKSYNLDDMEQFLENHKLLKLNYENMNGL